MQLMRAILVDDESASLKTLELLLNKYGKGIEIAGLFNDPIKALPAIKKLAPDVLFLDIEMPGLSGFQLVNKLKGYKGKVVFVTAHGGYALNAFKLSAFDFLLKPVAKEELLRVLKKLSTTAATPDAGSLLLLSQNLKFLSAKAANKMAVSVNEGIEIVHFDELEYLQADRNYCTLHRKAKKPLVVAKPLKDFEEVLPAEQFVRVHHSYILNINCVQRYVRADGGYAVMNNAKEITISRSFKNDFMAALGI